MFEQSFLSLSTVRFHFYYFPKIITLILSYFVFQQLLFRRCVRASVWREIDSEGDKYGKPISIKTVKLLLKFPCLLNTHNLYSSIPSRLSGF